MAQPSEIDNASAGMGDGYSFGKTSTSKISFYGETPVVQYVGAGAASTYGTTTNTTAVFGFDSLAAVTSLVRQVSCLTQALRLNGMID